MTTFNNGPARGTVLRLRRSPFFLRVCVGPILDDTDHANAKIDALDQLDDVPRKHEQLYAYRLTAEPGHVHINARCGQGGFFPLSDYTLVDPQPADAVMRDRKAWEAWCHTNRSMADFLKANNPSEPRA